MVVKKSGIGHLRGILGYIIISTPNAKGQLYYHTESFKI